MLLVQGKFPCKESSERREHQRWQVLVTILRPLFLYSFGSTILWRDCARRRSWAWFQAGRWECTRRIWLLLKRNGCSDFDSQFLSFAAPHVILLQARWYSGAPLDIYLVYFRRRPSQSLCQEELGPGRERRLGRISLYSNALTVSSSLSHSTTLPFLRPFLREERARLITSSYWHLIRGSCMILMHDASLIASEVAQTHTLL